MGDGGFGMTMGEMATAVMHNIATIAIVMDNGTWGSEIAYQRDFYNQRYIGAHVLSPRFDEVMKLCGGNGYFATEPGTPPRRSARPCRTASPPSSMSRSIRTRSSASVETPCKNAGRTPCSIRHSYPRYGIPQERAKGLDHPA